MLKNILALPRKGWQWLTKMKTALALLFLLAIAAIPGALLPQRSLNEDKVTKYIDANGKTAEVFDKLSLFDVFSSTWFAAIYVLLFVSLIGIALLPATGTQGAVAHAVPRFRPRGPVRRRGQGLPAQGV